MPLVSQGYELWGIPRHAYGNSTVHPPARIVAWDINVAAHAVTPIFEPAACTCPGETSQLLLHGPTFGSLADAGRFVEVAQRARSAADPWAAAS